MEVLAGAGIGFAVAVVLFLVLLRTATASQRAINEKFQEEQLSHLSRTRLYLMRMSCAMESYCEDQETPEEREAFQNKLITALEAIAQGVTREEVRLPPSALALGSLCSHDAPDPDHAGTGDDPCQLRGGSADERSF